MRNLGRICKSLQKIFTWESDVQESFNKLGKFCLNNWQLKELFRVAPFSRKSSDVSLNISEDYFH